MSLRIVKSDLGVLPAPVADRRDTARPSSPCSIEMAEEGLRILEGRWKLMILFQLFQHGPMRFSGLERAIDGVSQKVLIQQLRDLERSGVVMRTVYPQMPPRVEYALTPVGLALEPTLKALLAWAELRSTSAQEPAIEGGTGIDTLN